MAFGDYMADEDDDGGKKEPIHFSLVYAGHTWLRKVVPQVPNFLYRKYIASAFSFMHDR